MTLLILEALGALVLLVLIVWWTMFSGRKNGELPNAHPTPDAAASPGQNELTTPPAANPAEPRRDV